MEPDQNEGVQKNTTSQDPGPTPDSSFPQKSQREASKNNHLGAGIAIGAGLGVALGLVFDNLALGIGIGVAIGVAIGAGMNARNGSQGDSVSGRGRALIFALLIGGLVLLLGILLVRFLILRQ